MDPMLAKARRWFPTLRGHEADLYQTAWESVLRNRERVVDVEKYLECALYSAGLAELRTRRRKRTTSLESVQPRSRSNGEPLGAAGADWLTDRTALLPEEQVELRVEVRLLEEVLYELSPLQRTIVKLRWGFGIPRAEAAAMLGVSERVLKRELEDAAPLLFESSRLVRAEAWCETRRSLVLAYALELLSAKRARKAVSHLEKCVGCRQLVRELRGSLREIGALAPLTPIAVCGHSEHFLHRTGELLESARGALHGLSGARHQVISLFVRPSGDAAAGQIAAAGGLRGGGTIAATLAACVAAGSGATYCAVDGVPAVVKSVAGIEQQLDGGTKQDQKQPAQRVQDPSAETPLSATPAPAAQPDPASSQPAATEAKPQTVDTGTASAPASPAPAGTSEFGSAQASSAPRTPAPATGSGAGEFGP
jgi:RNA polymerase sigma factor (sigma-70 family)